jgi:hypothetical protein
MDHIDVKLINEKIKAGEKLEPGEKIFYKNIPGLRKTGLKYSYTFEEIEEIKNFTNNFNYFFKYINLL